MNDIKDSVAASLVSWDGMTADPDLTKPLRFLAESRAALIMAGRRVNKLNFERCGDPALPLLRRAFREARRVARQFEWSRVV